MNSDVYWSTIVIDFLRVLVWSAISSLLTILFQITPFAFLFFYSFITIFKVFNNKVHGNNTIYSELGTLEEFHPVQT